MKSYLMDPEFFDISEALVICKVVDKKDAVCAFVVGTGNSSESLLPSSIPNLQLNNAIIDIKRPKINLNLKSTPILAR